MSLAVHIVNPPLAGARDDYVAAWGEIDARGLRHPSGRRLHLAWMVGDVLHVVDVWDSPEQQKAFMRDLEPILDSTSSGWRSREAPAVGEFLQVVQPPA